MRTQEQAFRAYYAAMTDPELLEIAAHRNSYISVAQRTLAEEMEKRHLAPAQPTASPARHSLLWNWGNQLSRFARRPRHHPASP